MDVLKAAEHLLSKLTADTEPPSLMVPQEIVADGPDAVNDFTQAFDDLAKAVAAQR